jgi:hypothetical protein
MLANGAIIFGNRSTKKLHIWRQTQRVIRPNPSKDAPLPEVISVAQQAGTNYVDVTSRITDADSATVEVGLLGFVDGGNDLSKVIVPTTFVGDVTGKLGQNVPTGQNHVVTWDAGADWGVGFGEVEMEVLAKDDRNLLSLHFLTLPAIETNATELKISRTPVSNAELLSLWYWLVATGHSGITLNNGTITLDSNSDSLASGSSTTSAGRAYLLNLMNLREASAAEVARAKEGGTPGVTNQFTPTILIGPGERPVKVNEYGFETSNNNDFWVIPTN